MKAIYQRIRRSHFLKNVAVIGSATSIAQLITIAVSPILTRFFTPEQFGVAAMFLALSGVISSVSTGRYELAILLPDKDSDAKKIAQLAFLLCLITSALVFVVTYFIGSELILIFNYSELSSFLPLLTISVLLSGVYQILILCVNRDNKFQTMAKNRVLQSIITALSQLTLGIVALGSIGIIAGTLLGQVFSIAFFYKSAGEKIKFTVDKYELLSFKKIAVRYKNFPLFDGVSVFLSVSASQLPNILLASYFSPAVAGFFYLTQRAMQAPVTLVASSFMEVFRQRAANDYSRLGSARPIFIKTFFLLLSISFPLSLILFYSIKDIFIFVFGQDWVRAGEYAEMLIPALGLRLIVNPLSYIFYIAGKQSLNLIGALLSVLLIFLSIESSTTPEAAVLKISVSQCFVYLGYLCVGYFLSENKKND